MASGSGGRRLGILGGTFDPIHLGHLRAAEEVRDMLGLEELWLVPAARPPHKGRGGAPFQDRLRMAALAIEGCRGMVVKDLEARRPGPSYTVDTLEEVARREPGAELHFLVGSDGFLQMDRWRSHRRLVELAALVVMARGEAALERCREALPRLFPGHRRAAPGRWEAPGLHPILFLPVTRLDVSSTLVRSLARRGRSVRFLVPEKVRLYMEEKGLYSRETVETAERQRGSMGPKELALALARAVDDNKGEGCVILEVAGTSSFADYFVIAHGRSTRHVQGMTDGVRAEMKKRGVYPRSVEGEGEGKWVLMDYGDVIVHLFYGPVREFYDLEGLWHEAPRIDPATGEVMGEGEG